MLKGQRRVPFGTIRGRHSWRRDRSPAFAELVSVVIPCYGQAQYLGEAIESVLAQTYPHLEIVVVDDGSGDNASARSPPATRACAASASANSGVAAARNVGIRNTNGDFLVFLDADDRLLPDGDRGRPASARGSRPECAAAVGTFRRTAYDNRPLETHEQPVVRRDQYEAADAKQLGRLPRSRDLPALAVRARRAASTRARSGRRLRLQPRDRPASSRSAATRPWSPSTANTADNSSGDAGKMLEQTLAAMRKQKPYLAGRPGAQARLPRRACGTGSATTATCWRCRRRESRREGRWGEALREAAMLAAVPPRRAAADLRLRRRGSGLSRAWPSRSSPGRSPTSRATAARPGSGSPGSSACGGSASTCTSSSGCPRADPRRAAVLRGGGGGASALRGGRPCSAGRERRCSGSARRSWPRSPKRPRSSSTSAATSTAGRSSPPPAAGSTSTSTRASPRPGTRTPSLPFEVGGHDRYVTVGLNIGKAGCPVPRGGIEWIPTLPPVVLEEWPATPPPAGPLRFTTVATWRSPYGQLPVAGRLAGLKHHQFRRVLELPERVPAARFELALDIHAGDGRTSRRCATHGWGSSIRRSRSPPARRRSAPTCGAPAPSSRSPRASTWRRRPAGSATAPPPTWRAAGRRWSRTPGPAASFPGARGCSPSPTTQEAAAQARRIAADPERHAARGAGDRRGAPGFRSGPGAAPGSRRRGGLS